MTVTSVHLASDAYFVCLAHALSTEKEEIMGLLIGEVKLANCIGYERKRYKSNSSPGCQISYCNWDKNLACRLLKNTMRKDNESKIPVNIRKPRDHMPM